MPIRFSGCVYMLTGQDKAPATVYAEFEMVPGEAWLCWV